MEPDALPFVIIALTMGAQMIGMPKMFSPFAAGVFGVLLTIGYNWSSLGSVERITDIGVSGFVYGAMAVGAHKTWSTVGEVIGQWRNATEEK